MTAFGKIGIIGGGKMGSALVGGLRTHGINASDIIVVDSHPETIKDLKQTWGVVTLTTANEIMSQVDILVLAVKPHDMKALMNDIAPQFNPAKTLLISIAAGITTSQMKKWLKNADCPLVRAMPNTPALLGEGMSGLYATEQVTMQRKHQAQTLLASVGKTVWLEDESLIDVVTALSGSGPAYFFYLMELLINSATSLGLPPEVASFLTLQTARGSAIMAQQSKEDVATLRANVTSKGGTTEAGIKVLKDGKLQDLITKTLSAASERGKELSQQYD